MIIIMENAQDVARCYVLADGCFSLGDCHSVFVVEKYQA